MSYLKRSVKHLNILIYYVKPKPVSVLLIKIMFSSKASNLISKSCRAQGRFSLFNFVKELTLAILNFFIKKIPVILVQLRFLLFFNFVCVVCEFFPHISNDF